MKINLARSAGFCFGVKRALSIARQTALTGKNVCMLGDIVHNETVVKEMQSLRIRRIRRLGPGEGRTLIISAHGARTETFTRARGHGYRVVDATCPMVKTIHRIARDMERKGYRIIVIGDKKHTEVRGIVGQLKRKALVIDHNNRLPVSALKKIPRAAVVVQSTQDMEKVLTLTKKLKALIPGLLFFNTICRPTRIKQKEIRSLPLDNDAVLIIGSRHSANTRRLYEISRSLNRRTYWVSTVREIKKAWFKGVKNLGVTAGASTPQSAIRAVIGHIRNIS
ncbi:MAG: 4-hydroxy-3-methylbut-2-enyl diphosphate reductase [Candidatus Omnitrophica bacterium]|nr:4-hydroxy-3-methylbut-2-enyl diphosphate reductase [Candidatus Omnitrophota bacterium]